ncbi:MAG: GAF domain-containing protein [candidate division NC10 bacterium]|nr:GAF domain-containing protein [candidate division NC10 bacterium]
MGRFSFSSLRVRIPLLVLLATIPALVLILYTVSEQRRDERADAEREGLLWVRQVSHEHERLIDGARQLLVALAHLPAVHDQDAQACRSLFAKILGDFPHYAGLAAQTPQGEIFCSSRPTPGPVRVADREYFQRTLATRDFTVSGYLIGRVTGRPVMALTYPALDQAGNVRAVVFAGLDLRWLNRLAVRAQLPPGSVFLLVDRNGTILARSPDSESWIGKPVRETPLFQAMRAQQGEGTLEVRDQDGVPRLYGFSPLQGAPGVRDVYVAVGIPTQVAFASSHRALTRGLALLGLVSFLALATAWVGGNAVILGPVRELVTATKRLGAGDLSARTGLAAGPGELNQLASAFDEMAAALERQSDERRRAEAWVRESEERFRTFVSHAPVGIIVTNTQGECLFVNERWFKMAGLSEEEALGRGWMRALHPEDRERVVAGWSTAAQDGPEFSMECRFQSPDGKTTWATGGAVALRDDAGDLTGYLGTLADITDLKRAEEAVWRAEERYRRLFAEAPVMYVISRSEKGIPVITDCNEVFLRILGYTRPEVLGRPLGDFYVPESQVKLLDLGGYRRALEGRFDVEERELLARDGRVIPVLIRSVPETDPDGHASGTRAMYLDITQRKQAEEALARRTSQLDTVRTVTAEITRELDLSTLLDLITQRALELVEGTSGVVSLWDEQAQCLVPKAWRGHDASFEAVRYRLGEGVGGTVAQRRQGLIVNEYRTSPHAHPWILTHTAVTACVAEPLLYQGRLLGVISAGRKATEQRFTEADRQLLALFAAQAAIAIENARLYQAERRRAAELEAVMEVSRDMVGERRMEMVLRQVVSRAVDLTRAHSGTLYLWDEAEQALRPHAWVNIGDFIRDIRYPLGQGITGTVAECGRGLIWNRYREDARHDDQLLRHVPLEACMAAPLASRDHLVGVLTLNHAPGRQFSAEDMALLEIFANQTAAVIENARLYTTEQERCKQLEAIRDITAEITRELDLATLLDLIHRRAAELVSASSGSVWLWDEAAQVLVPAAWHGQGEWMRGRRPRLGEGVAGTVAERRQGMMLNDYRTSPHAVPLVLERSGITAVLSEPLVYRHRLLGVIGSHHHDPGRRFTHQDRELLALFATQAAIAIQNAQLFEQVRAGRERLERLTRKVVSAQEEERRSLSRELHDEAGQALTALRIGLELVLADLPQAMGALRQRIGQAVALTEATTEQIRLLAQDLRPPALDTVGLNATLEGFCQDFAKRTGSSIAYRGTELPGVSDSASICLYRFLQEALTNAAKHAQANQVRVALRSEGETIRLSVEDDGRGFDSVAVTSISGQRTGIGLLGMRERLDALGGRLEIQSEPGTGARLIATIPAKGVE